MGIIKIWVKGMLRRKRQLARVGIAAFLVIMFITGIILFQENMYQWQMAVNKERFGDWFITESRRNPTEELLKHPYLEKPAESTYLFKVHDENWKELNFFIGHVTEEFIKQGRIDVDEGRLPEKAGEIALEWNSLASLGYEAKLGDKIVIRYYDGPVYLAESKIEKEYILTGILSNYTSVWNVGVGVPAAIISDAEYELIENKEDLYHTYIYPLDISVITDDYSLVYENVEDLAGRSIIGYNAYVYDFQPWGSEFVYNYMYVIVMVIGITAFVYQIIVYQRARKESYVRHILLGANNGFVKWMAFAELMAIVVVCGLTGMISAVFIGKVICGVIEADMNVDFYYVSEGLYLKSCISLLGSVIVGELVSIVVFNSRIRKAKPKRVSDYVPKTRITPGNIVSQTQRRLSRTSGKLQAVLVRGFALCVTAVMLVCFYNIWSAYNAYAVNDDRTDIMGVRQTGNKYPYKFLYFAKTYDENKIYSNILPYYDCLVDMDFEEYVPLYKESLNRESKWGHYIRRIECEDGSFLIMELGTNYGGALISSGNANLTHGFDDVLVERIQSVPGVEKIEYAAFEADRDWLWDGKTLDKTGYFVTYKSYDYDNMKKPDSPYLFATQYLNIDRALYDKLSKYMDKSVANYDEFVKGNQVLLIMDKTPNNEYDDSISVGEKLGYAYYDFYDRRYYSDREYVYSYGSAYQKLLEDKSNEYFYNELQGLPYEEYRKKNEEYNFNHEYMEYSLYAKACQEPTVAGIVYLDDELKEELQNYIVKFGYYTAIASVQLGEKLMEGQKAYMEEWLGEPLPADIDVSMKYNQVSVKYNMASTYSATDNVVRAYFKQNDIYYSANANEKANTRSATVNAILFYGITAIGAAVVYIFVGVIVVGNRIENRRTRFVTLIRLGSDKEKVVKMCMRESARESLWCILLLPLQLFVHLVMYKRAIRNIN